MSARSCARHWQRKPLLVRARVPGLRGPAHARRGDAPRRPRRGAVAPHHGARAALERSSTARSPPRASSNFHAATGRCWCRTRTISRAPPIACSRSFDFIPHARIDDVMVSYAVPGGSVGPARRFVRRLPSTGPWTAPLADLLADAIGDFEPGLPLRILERFEPEQEWVLEAGDMLYLPPGVAHHGVAETECLTWSIGFRAPSDGELVAGFLDYLREDARRPRAITRDAGGAARAPCRARSRRGSSRTPHARWRASAGTPRSVREFAGRFLTEPKAHVFFDPPRAPARRARASPPRGARRSRTRSPSRASLFLARYSS